MEPLVSFVTPFYNTRDFLVECIESVLHQTYANWEYVLVDNQSTDGSSEIAAQYASRFPEKIRVIRTESFLSQVENYNFALTRIALESKYCKMVQADDWLFPECVSRMVEIAEEHPSVGIVGAYRLENDQVDLDGLPYPSSEVSGREVCRLYLLKNKYVLGSPTSVLYRSEVLSGRNPFFEERYAPFEDGHVCLDILRTWNFGFVHQVLTYSRWGNDGIMARVFPFGIEGFVNLSMLVAHGKVYLSAEEYDRRLKRFEQRYFLELTKHACAFRPASEEFWEFHRKGLAAINYSFDWKRIARWLPRAIADKAWNLIWRSLHKVGSQPRAET